MTQNVYKTDDGNTVIANMMNDVAVVSFKEYILKFHSYSIAPVISKLVFNVFGFLPVDSIARIVSRQSFELAKEELLNLKKVALPQEIKTLLNSDLKKKEQEKILKGISFRHKPIGSTFFTWRRIRIQIQFLPI